jgi:peptidyl-prolyl cis-trans isomerase D
LVTNARAKKWFDQVSKSWVGGDTVGYPAAYAAGKVLSARHILLVPPQGDTTAKTSDSLRRKAVALRAELTPANFASMAEKNSKDPGSARRGGDLGAFDRGQMVAPFEQALLTLKPGQISEPIRTQFGWHIIYRPTYAEARDEIVRKLGSATMQTAESTYVAHLDAASDYKFLPSGTATVRAVTKDPDVHKGDQTAIATYVGGNFTAGRLARWMSLFPPQMRQQLQAAPDSQVPTFVRNVVRNEMVVRQADSAKVTLDSAEMAALRQTYEQLIVSDWSQLGLDPKMLADSDKTEAGRDRLAAAHVEDYLGRMVAMTARYVDVAQPIEQALRSKYESEINEAGVDRAVSRAAELRKVSDSARAAKEPPSAVPLPGAVPNAGPGAGAPAAPGARAPGGAAPGKP